MVTTKKRKYALILSGGGFNGAFQLGALKYIKEHGIAHQDGEVNREFKFDIIAGISTGALTGAMLAMDRFDLFQTLWQEVVDKGYREIFTTKLLNRKGKIRLMQVLWQVVKGSFNNFRKVKAIANNSPLRQKLEEHLMRDKITCEKFITGFVSLDDGEYYSVSHEDFYSDADLIKGVLASTCFPVVFEPVNAIKFYQPDEMGHPQLKLIDRAIDGGIRTSSPIGDVIRQIARQEALVRVRASETAPGTSNPAQSQALEDLDDYHFIIINCNSGGTFNHYQDRNIFRIGMRAFYEIALTEVFNGDVSEFTKTNDLVRQAKTKGIDLRVDDAEVAPLQQRILKSFSYKIIQPQPGELGSAFGFKQEDIENRVTFGYKIAQRVMEELEDENWS